MPATRWSTMLAPDTSNLSAFAANDLPDPSSNISAFSNNISIPFFGNQCV
jgi:hypothetical protein